MLFLLWDGARSRSGPNYAVIQKQLSFKQPSDQPSLSPAHKHAQRGGQGYG